ncbi:EscU/YscU/HrcU family type III secretion system export apparatus switch protein [Stenotrophomonas sp. NPDC077659]|uniref:EscU/YscU/HrcU family type III secretion system export apparatus switch protein n=1 Tax=Stenotrophomonas sp. NPDC077659 TaxID=3390694 RepID=UPI003D04C1F7
MSSGASEKTEKPTPKRLRKEAEKGKSYNSRDLLAAAVLWTGGLAMATLSGFQAVRALYTDLVGGRFQLPPAAAAVAALKAFAWAVMPVLAAALVAIVVTSLLMSRGILATEAIRLDLNRVNPVNGFKNLFTLKVIKDLVRALLYLLCAGLFCWLAFSLWGAELFGVVHATDAQLAATARTLVARVGAGLLLALAPVYLLAGWVDHLLHIRELKMEKHEVKRERKDNEISEQVRHRRREIGDELSAQVQADTTGSTLVLANPTHIAIGIFLMDDDVPMPFVSVREQGARARKVIALAERSGVPVVRDIRLARAVFARSRRYRFVHDNDIDGVMHIVRWLRDVERASQAVEGDVPATDVPAHAPLPASPSPPHR